MPERMTPGKILGENEKFLLYGDPGTGKTFAALTAPEPIWVLGVGGTNEFKTAYSNAFLKKHGQKEIYFDFVKEERGLQGMMSENPTGYDHVCDMIDAFLEWNDKEGVGVKTIVIDNASMLDEYIMNKAIVAEYELANSTTKTTLTRELEHGIRKPGDNTYGGAQSLMNRIITWTFELPFHLVLVGHERKVYEQKGENSRDSILKSIIPEFVGKLRVNVPNRFDNVWRFNVSGGGRTAQFEAQTMKDNIIMAKTRVSGLLEERERDINISDVIKEFKNHAAELEKQTTNKDK